jgi:hypothetical protein
MVMIKSVNISSKILNFGRDISSKKSKKVYLIITMIKLVNISSEIFNFRLNIYHMTVLLYE